MYICFFMLFVKDIIVIDQGHLYGSVNYTLYPKLIP